MGALLIALMMLTGLGAPVVQPHVNAAEAVETDEFPADLILSIAWHESGLNPYALHFNNCKAVSRCVWTEPVPPPHTSAWCCGPLQFCTRDWGTCISMRSIDVAYPAAVEHLQGWADHKACVWKRGLAKIDCAVAGYGGGNKALLLPTTKYVQAINYVRRQLQVLVRRAGEV